MRCIGDECIERLEARPVVRRAPSRVLRSVAMGAVCAGLGAVIAGQYRAADRYAASPGFAPPMVMTSGLGTARTRD